MSPASEILATFQADVIRVRFVLRPHIKNTRSLFGLEPFSRPVTVQRIVKARNVETHASEIASGVNQNAKRKRCPTLPPRIFFIHGR